MYTLAILWNTFEKRLRSRHSAFSALAGVPRPILNKLARGFGGVLYYYSTQIFGVQEKTRVMKGVPLPRFPPAPNEVNILPSACRLHSRISEHLPD